MRALLLALFVVCISGCVAPSEPEPPETRVTAPIIKGHECEAGGEAGPTLLVILQATSRDSETSAVLQGICTASLVAPDTIVSAAHCFDTSDLDRAGLADIHFFVSRASRASALSALPADAIEVRAKVHPDFDCNSTPVFGTLGNFHDVAVGFLKRPILDLAPAILPTRRETAAIVQGASVTIAGWGATDPVATMTSTGVLHCAAATIAAVGDAEMVIGPNADSARKCHGDSGGPTFLTLPTATSVRKDRLIGVTSRGYRASDCAEMGGVDTRVDVFRDWVDAQMRQGCDDGSRVWCDVRGVVPPSFYGGPVEPEEQLETQGGCGVGRERGDGLIGAIACTLLALRRSRATRVVDGPRRAGLLA